MKEQTKVIIMAAIDGDDDINPRTRAQIAAILNGTQAKRSLITTRQACEILGCCSLTLLRYERRGHIHPIRFSKRKKRFDKLEISNLANNGIAVNEEGSP